MGAEKSKPVPADASQSTKNVIERENLKASQVVDQRRATVHRAAKARMSVIAMSGGYNSNGGPVAGFLPGGPALRPSLQDEQLPPGLPNTEDAHKTPKAAAPAAAGFQAGTALAYGTGVMKDPPKNVFGPGHVVSPDMYPEFHRATWVAEAGTGVPLGLLHCCACGRRPSSWAVPVAAGPRRDRLPLASQAPAAMIDSC